MRISDWSSDVCSSDLRLSGTYSESDTSVRTSFFARGALTSVATPKYYNKLRSIELGSEGPLMQLPGGEARLALGVGYRSNTLNTDSRRVIGSVETLIDVFSETRAVGCASAFGSAPCRERVCQYV